VRSPLREPHSPSPNHPPKLLVGGGMDGHGQTQRAKAKQQGDKRHVQATGMPGNTTHAALYSLRRHVPFSAALSFAVFFCSISPLRLCWYLRSRPDWPMVRALSRAVVQRSKARATPLSEPPPTTPYYKASVEPPGPQTFAPRPSNVVPNNTQRMYPLRHVSARDVPLLVLLVRC
jgi:hypothetical protein